MLWGNGGETPEGGAASGGSGLESIHVERDAPRPATILKVATELEERGAQIRELFKEISSPLGEVALPIHLLRDGRDVFVEVETVPELISAYPPPREIGFFFGTSPAALLQLALTGADPEMPEQSAALFREAASRHWAVDLDYEPGYLPLVEELLMAAFDEDAAPPILDSLVVGLGCFVGETVRRNANQPGAWRTDEDWGEGPVLDVGWLVLDPVGKARAFLLEGPEDSITFYANYVLEQLTGGSEEGSTPTP